MKKLRALDAYCCAGGASRGLADAGFEVEGVDKEEQRQFDLIWASPPCQHFTAYKRRPGHDTSTAAFQG